MLRTQKFYKKRATCNGPNTCCPSSTPTQTVHQTLSNVMRKLSMTFLQNPFSHFCPQGLINERHTILLSYTISSCNPHHNLLRSTDKDQHSQSHEVDTTTCPHGTTQHHQWCTNCIAVRRLGPHCETPTLY